MEPPYFPSQTNPKKTVRRRLIRRFLAMLMQPVRLQFLESDGMMGWFLMIFGAQKNHGKWWKIMENDEETMK